MKNKYDRSNDLLGSCCGKMPVSIEKSPILEAIFEIRFEPNIPGDAVFGLVYNAFKEEFTKAAPLPILQFPEQLRSTDPNLKFMPHYRMDKENFIIQIGPNVFNLANTKPYCGWSNFSQKIEYCYGRLSKIGIMSNHISTAIRYINVFEESNIFEKMNMEIQLAGKVVGQEHIDFSTIIPHDNDKAKSRLKITTFANIHLHDEKKDIIGSIIDIDTVFTMTDPSEFKESIQYVHEEQKKLFFGSLKQDFIESLSPKYEE
jgi:uncharacterized protein (TIGR04255 family)